MGNVIFDPQQSYGAAIGFDPDTTVPVGSSRLYSYFVDKELGTNLVLNMGDESSCAFRSNGPRIPGVMAPPACAVHQLASVRLGTSEGGQG